MINLRNISAVLMCISTLCLMTTTTLSADDSSRTDMPSSVEKKHMKSVGYNDLDGRESLQVTVKGDWAYVGHLNRLSHQTVVHINHLTGIPEENGTSILDISDPSNPTLVAHIPNKTNLNSRSVSVVYDFKGSGKDYLVRNREGNDAWILEIFDITNRTDGISAIGKVGEITGTPVGSCAGSPCGGTLTRAHKGYFSQSGKYYASASEPGFGSGSHLIVWDLSTLPKVKTPGPADNYNHTFVGRGWIPGQKLTDTPVADTNLHHPIVDELNDVTGARVYAGYLTGGDVVAFDISNTLAPNFQFPVAWHIDTDPPGRGTHTVAPVLYDQVANFGDEALPRVYALVADEGLGSDIKCLSPVRTKNYMFDITDADRFSGGTGIPFPVETWQVPDGDFCNKGGRFGPHQFNETVNGLINRFEDKIAFFAYFNAGVRVVDISDPYNLVEVGYYIPQANERASGIDQAAQDAGEFVIHINDVDVDYRGLIYASDRVGSGFFVLEYAK